MKKIFLFFLLLFSVSVFAIPFETNLPVRLSQNGYFVDDNRTILIKIYSASSGGLPLFTETQDNNFVKGIGNIVIGDTNTLTASMLDGNKYVGFSINGGAETTRILLRPTMTAIVSAYADHLLDENQFGRFPSGVIADWNKDNSIIHTAIANAPWLTSFSDTNWQTSFPVFDANMSLTYIKISDTNNLSRIDSNAISDWNSLASLLQRSIADANNVGWLKQITIADANNLGWLSQKTIGDANNSSWLDYATIANPPWLTSFFETDPDSVHVSELPLQDGNIGSVSQTKIFDANNSSWLDYVVIANAPWLTSFSDTNWQTSFPVFDANMAAKYSKIIDTNGADNLLAKTSDINGTYAKSLDVNGADNLRYLKTDVNSNFVPFQNALQDVNLGTRNFLTTGTLGAGAITGTSFIIAAHTLDETEWHYLDGQDQSVFTTSTPTFAATLFTDKVKFTQTDGNEYIDSLADAYMDYGATTGHRFLIGGTEQINLIDGTLRPTTTNDVDLGASTLAYKMLYTNGIRLGTAGATAPYIFPFSGSSYSSPSATGTNTTFYTYSIAGNNYGVVFTGETVTATSNVYYNFVSPRLFQPASGDAMFVTFAILGGVNQSAVGAPTGITRGLWVNQTLTSPYDYRAIETSNSLGYAFYGAGTAPIYLKGAINSALALTTVNGSVGGTAIWSMPFQGASYKKFAVNMQALNSTTKTITYPVVFLTQPYIYGDAAALAVSSTNTTTFTITTPAVITGSVFVEGY